MIRQTQISRRNRCGAAAMVALVLIAVLGAMTAVMLKDFHRNVIQRRQSEIRAQASQLLADFKDRTLSRLQTDPAAPDERIVIPPFSERFDGTFTLTFDPAGIKVEYVESVDDRDKTVYVETQSLDRTSPTSMAPASPDNTINDHEN